MNDDETEGVIMIGEIGFFNKFQEKRTSKKLATQFFQSTKSVKTFFSMLFFQFLGGSAEEDAAEWLKHNNPEDKPIVSFIAGVFFYSFKAQNVVRNKFFEFF